MVGVEKIWTNKMERKFQRLPFDVHDIIFMDYFILCIVSLGAKYNQQLHYHNSIRIIKSVIKQARKNGRAESSLVKIDIQESHKLSTWRNLAQKREKERPAVVFGGVCLCGTLFFFSALQVYVFFSLLFFSFTKKARVFDLPQTSCLGKKEA